MANHPQIVLFNRSFKGLAFFPSKTFWKKDSTKPPKDIWTRLFFSHRTGQFINQSFSKNLPHGAAAFSTHPMPWHEALTNLISLHDLTTSRVACAQWNRVRVREVVDVETELRRWKTKSIPQKWCVNGWLVVPSYVMLYLCLFTLIGYWMWFNYI